MEVSDKKVELSSYGAFEHVKKGKTVNSSGQVNKQASNDGSGAFGYFSNAAGKGGAANSAGTPAVNPSVKAAAPSASAEKTAASPASVKSALPSGTPVNSAAAAPGTASPAAKIARAANTSKNSEENKPKQPKKRASSKSASASYDSKLAKKSAVRVRHPIGVTLIMIISAIVVIALGGVTYAVSYFVSSDVRTSAEENNLAINSRTASDVESRIGSAVSSVSMFLELVEGAGSNSTEVKSLENLFFDHNKSVVALYVQDTASFFVSQAFFISREIETEDAKNYFLQELDSFELAKSGSIGIHNASSYFRQPVLSIFYPYLKNGKMHVAGFLYSADELSDSFASGSVNKSIFVNSDGELLVSNDASEMLSGKDESKNIFVVKMLESTQNNSQFSLKDENEKEFIGAFRKLASGGGGVVTTVETAIVLEGVRATTRRNIYISVAILFMAILIIYFFARSMSTPLKQLTAIVNDINRGNFNTVLFSGLNTKRNDEIGVLARSTKNEREILNTFTSLTNKGVTEAIIKKEIDFNPHLKDITIFFSDIRGFTAISDGFKNRFKEKSAGEIISFLNDYMSRMVTCIRRTGGVVDKFEGDAIMAAWGVLRNESLDWEKLPDSDPDKAELKKKHDAYVKRDALSGITSCIAMRYSLMLYNKEAEAFTKAHEDEPLAKYKPHIRIGAGLNCGRATVGFMGSNDKMEFTSIGDAVNFASRTEASNKPCGTDILITQDIFDILKYDYIRCPENNYTIRPENEKSELIVEQIPVDFEVKGKGVQHFFGVVNMPRFDIAEFFKVDPSFVLDPDCERAVGPKGPKTLNEMRTLLGIPIPDFEKVNLNEEENKIQVANT